MATDHNFRIKNGLEVGGQLIVTSSGQLAVATVSSQLQFLDNVKAKFGNGSDLQIYHNGSNSYIDEGGTGDLLIRTNGTGVRLQKNTGEHMIKALTDGAVTLYYDNQDKLATTSTGIDVTGTAVVDTAFTLENIATLNQSSNNLYIKTITNGTGIVLESRTGYVTIRPTSGVTNAQFRPSGDNYLGYESTGANAKLFWDASAESLGIGTTSPAKNLHVAGDARISDGNGLIDFNPGYIPINATHSSGYAHIQINGMQFGGNSTSTSEGYMKPADNSRKLAVDSNGFRFYIGGIASSDELIRFDSTGKVGIGTTSPAQLLTVEGGAEAIGLNLTGSGSRLTIGSDGTYNYFRAKSGNQFKFTTTGGSDLLLNNAGVLTLSAGTSNRTVQLQDDGLYISRTTDGAYTSKVVSDTNTNDLAVYARSYINFYHDSTKRFSFRETGALGINEASPNYTIHAKKDMASSPSNIIYLEMAGTNANGGGGAIRFDTSASNTDETMYYASVEGIRSSSSDGSNELHFKTAKVNVNSNAATTKMLIDEDGDVGIGLTAPSARLHVQGTTTDSSADAFRASDSSGTSLLRVRNDGVILIEDNYLYVTSNAGAYFDNSIKARGGIHNDSGTLLLNDDVNVTGQLQVYNGSSTNRIRLYTETGTAQIADTFADTTTQKSYIYFDAGTGSNDPGYIMHETSDSEQNEGVLHLVPTDDNATTDYVSIHGTNDADCIRLHTSGLIETGNNHQLTLKSGSGDLNLNDNVTVTHNLTVTGDFVVNGSTTTFNTATLDVEDKNITLNYGSGDTSATAGGAGITIQDAVDASTDATILWNATNDRFDFSHAINVTGNITVSGTVDGRDIATDGSKLDNIEANATADQTASEILTAIKTVDGSGSGLNADLLDNQQGSYYLDANNLTGTINNNRLASSVVITDGGTYATGFASDLNTITGWRIHRVTGYSGSTDNRAFTSHHNLFTMPNTSSAGPYSIQIAAETNSSPDMKFRASYGSTSSWSSWNKIWTDNNDGSGSGLDADLLDGINSASFLRSDATDTASGALTFSGSTTFTGNIGNSTTTVDSVKIGVSSAGDPQIQLTGDGVNAHIDFSNASGQDYDVRIINNASNQLDFQGLANTGLKSAGNTVWHAGNDGSGSGLDADLLDGQHGSYYLNYNNFTNTPTSLPANGGNSDTVDNLHAASFLRSDAADTSSATYIFSRTSTTPVFDISGHAGASSYNYFLRAGNDGGNKAVHFVNGSTRTADHGANAYVIRNDGGKFVLGKSSYPTELVSSGNLTINNNTAWHAGNDGSGSGLDADTLDGINSGSFLRSDAADTATHQITFNSTPILAGTTSSEGGELNFGAPTGGVYSAFALDNYQGHFRVHTLASGKEFRIHSASSGLTTIGSNIGTVWASGNDGSGSGLDADTLDGQHASAFLGVSSKAADSELLDGINSTSFLRSDTSDTFTGTLTMAGALNMGNQQIYAINNLRFNDPGVNEGIKWDGGNEWQIYESPDNQSNASGNLQFTSGSGNGTIRMTLDTSGNLNVTGTLTATAKSFDIEHPTKEGMRLHHGVLEGPEHAVYIRGRTKGSLIQLPEYWTGLVHEDTITVQLTPIGKSSELYVKDISNNKVLVSNDTEYFYFIQAERKDIERFEVEYGDSL